MTTEQRDRLVTTALILLGASDAYGVIHLEKRNMEFDMHNYAMKNSDETVPIPEETHTCGTSCCVLGLGACLYPELMTGKLWGDVPEVLYGIHEVSDDWNFLFSYKIKSDPYEIAHRVIHYLNLLPMWDFTMEGKSRNKQEVDKQLRALLV